MATEDLAADPVGPLADEFVERRRRGERPSVTEYTARHPGLADRIRQVFSMVMLMEQAGSQDGEDSAHGGLGSAEKPATPERIGGYRILREIGRGGMGVVYEAEQTALGRHVALKVLPIGAARKRERLERFHREARAAARLHHTNIVPVFEVGTAGDLCYYAMQFIHGQPLDLVLEELRSLRPAGRPPAVVPHPDGGPADRQAVALSLIAGQASTQTQAASPSGPGTDPDFAVRSSAEPTGGRAPSSLTLTGPASAPTGRSGRWHYHRSVASVGVQVAEALAYAHQEGVIHRDIKPSNLLLDTAGRVWVTDFGLAYQPDPQARGGASLTQTGEIVGTIRYMPPERFRGWSDPRSDVYSLGLTLYEMLLLRPAFDAPEQVALMEMAIHEEPTRLRKADAQIPRDLETIILKAIDKEPAQRYPSAAELAGDLKRFLEDRPILARPSGVVERGWRWCKRNRAVAAFAAAFLLALLLGLVGSTWQWWRAEGHAVALGLREKDVRRERDEAREKQAEALQAQAHALITSGLEGQRFRSITALQEAARIRRSPRQRDLFISALALADLRPGVEWDGWNDESSFLVFDAPMQRYARSDFKGNISVRWIDGDREQFFLPGSAVAVSGLRFSPDGHYLSAVYHRAAGTWFCVWDLETRKLVLKNISVSSPAFDFTPDSRGIVMSRRDDLVCLYDLVSGELKREFGQAEDVRALAVDPAGQRVALSGHRHAVVEVRELSTGQVVAKLDHKTANGVGQVAWHPRNPDLLVAPAGGVYVWNVPKGELLVHVQDGAGLTTNVTFSHCGNFFATKGYGDTTIRLYDTWTGRPLVQVPGSISDARYSLQFGADDRLLAFSLEEQRIRLWRVELPTAYRSFGDIGRPGKGSYAHLGVHPSGRLLAVGARADGDIEPDGVALWDLHTGRQVEFLKIGRAYAAIFHPRGNALISAGDAGVYHWPIRMDPGAPDVWHVGPPRRLLEGESGQLDLSQDGRRLAVQSVGRGTVIDLPDEDSPASRPSGESGHPVERATGKGTTVQVSHSMMSRVSLSPDGGWLATGTHNGRNVKVWDARTGKLIKDLPAPVSANVRFSPDGKWLVTYSRGKYRVYQTGGSWELRHEITNSGGGSGGPIAFRPDGRVLAVQVSGFKVRLLDPATAHVFATLEAPDRDQSYAGVFFFSPDGNELFALTSELRLMHGWNLRRLGEQLTALGQPWDLPPFEKAAAGTLMAPAGEGEPERQGPAAPIRIVADLGELAGAEDRKQSEAALESEDWSKALAAADRALAKFNKDGAALLLRAEAHLGLKQFDQAVADYRQSLTLAPRDASTENRLAWMVVAHAEVTAEQAAQALLWAKNAVKLAPKEYTYWNTLGVAHYRAGAWGEAIKALRQSLNLSHGREYAHNAFFLAMAHWKRGGKTSALDWQKKAIDWMDKNAPDHKELVRFRAETLAGAREALRLELEKASRAIAENPDSAKALYERGLVHYHQDQFAPACDDFSRALAVDQEHVGAYHYRGHTHERLRQYDKAAADFTEALRRTPADAHLRYVRGLARYSLRQYDLAIEDWNQALDRKLAPAEEADARDHLARLYVAGPEQYRDLDKALPLARRAADLSPGAARLVATLGAVQYRLGQYDEAVKTLTRAAATKAGPTAYDQFFLAMSYHHLGETGKARDSYDRAVAWRKKQSRLTEVHAELLTSLQAETEGVLRE